MQAFGGVQVMRACEQVPPEQESAVQALESLQFMGAATHPRVASHTIGEQRSPAGHEMCSCWHTAAPVEELHESNVQALRSLQFTGFAVQVLFTQTLGSHGSFDVHS